MLQLYPIHDLNESERKLHKLAHDFSVNVLRPNSLKYEDRNQNVNDIAKQASEIGLRHWWVPKQYGGLGSTGRFDSCILSEEIAWGCLGLLECISGPSLPGLFILNYGNENQKQKYLPMLTDRNQMHYSAFALTEKDAGGDIQNLKTTATKTKSGYLLKGKKKFITNATIASYMLVAAKVLVSKKEILKFFILDVDNSNQNLKITRINTTGVRSAHVGEIEFNDVFVPQENIVGYQNTDPEQDDTIPLLKLMEMARLSVAACSLGVARASLEKAYEFFKENKRFGKDLIQHQGISFPFIDCIAEFQAMRAYTWDAARRYDRAQQMGFSENNLVKLHVTQKATTIVSKCCELVSAESFLEGSLLEKWYRDIRVCSIWEGTPNILRISASAYL